MYIVKKKKKKRFRNQIECIPLNIYKPQFFISESRALQDNSERATFAHVYPLHGYHSAHTHTRGLGRTLNKMVATSTLNYITNLSHIERKRRRFKLLLHIPAFEKSQIAGLAGAATVRFSRGNLRQGALAGGDLLLVAADQLERLGLGARDGRFLPG